MAAEAAEPPSVQEGEGAADAAPAMRELRAGQEQLFQYVKTIAASMEKKARAVPGAFVLAMAVCRAVMATQLAPAVSDLLCILALVAIASQADADGVPSLSQFQALEAAVATKAEAAEVAKLGDCEAVAAKDIASTRSVEELAALVAQKADLDKVPQLERFEELARKVALKADAAKMAETIRALEAKVDLGRAMDGVALLSGQLEQLSAATKALEGRVSPAQDPCATARGCSSREVAVSGGAPPADDLGVCRALPEEPESTETKLEVKVDGLVAEVDRLAAALRELGSDMEGRAGREAVERLEGALAGKAAKDAVDRLSSDVTEIAGAIKGSADGNKVDRLALSLDELAIAVQGKAGCERLDELATLVDQKADTTTVLSLEKMQEELQAVEERMQADIVALLSRFHRLVGRVEQLALRPAALGSAAEPREAPAPAVSAPEG